MAVENADQRLARAGHEIVLAQLDDRRQAGRLGVVWCGHRCRSPGIRHPCQGLESRRPAVEPKRTALLTPSCQHRRCGLARGSTSALSIGGGTLHICDMAKSPSKSSPQPAGASERRRRSPLTEFLDAAEPLNPKGLLRSAAGRIYRRAAHRLGRRLGRADREGGGSSARPAPPSRKARRRSPSAPPPRPRPRAAPRWAARQRRASAPPPASTRSPASTSRWKTPSAMAAVRRHRHGRGAVGADRERQPAAQERPAVDAAPARPARRNPKAASPSRWSPISSRPATSRRRSRTSSRASTRADRTQVLLGVTGSGKTFTMAKVIEETQRPALILAPNKTLAAQLYCEFKKFFPDNAVEYFVSYYDYYQPEAYVPRTDTYHREGIVDQRADRPHAPLGDALAARARRRHHRRLGVLHLRYRLGRDLHGDDLPDAGRRPARPARSCSPTSSPSNTSARTSISCAARSACAATRSRSSRPTWRTAPGASRMFGDEIETITEFDPLTGQKTGDLKIGQDLRQLALCDAAPDAQPGDQVDQGRAEAPPRRAGEGRPPAGGAAAGAAHPLRPRDAGGHRLLRRHRELFALSHRPPARRAAADAVRIHPRQRAGLHRRKPRHRAADRRHVSRRLPPQGDAGRIRLPPAVLHGQPAAALRGMGRHAPAVGRRLGDARRLGDGSRPAASSPSRSSARPA